MDTAHSNNLIADAARRIFAAHCGSQQLKAAEGDWSAALWRACEDAGFAAAFEPVGSDGYGVSTAEAMSIVRLAGEFAAPAPLAESMLAHRLLMMTGIEAPGGALTIAGLNPKDSLTLYSAEGGWRLSGQAHRAPFARFADAIVFILATKDGAAIALAPRKVCTMTPGENFAREPRDNIAIDAVLPKASAAECDVGATEIQAMAAALRVIQISGALDAILQRTIEYARTRVQFGRPISKFQVIQQYIAIIGGQVAAARAAANACVHALDGGGALFAVAAAKARVAEAATIASNLSHQVHGAIGFTQDYDLHYLTKRVWSWRDEFGSQTYWSRLLGDEICRRGADAMWHFITDGLRQTQKAS